MTTEATPRKSLPRRIRRVVLLAMLLLVVLIVAAPYLVSIPVVSRRVLKRLFADVHGTVTAERLDFGWFSPPHISGFEIHSPTDEPVISIGSITLEQPLWQLISHPAEIGRVTIDQPHAYLILTKNGSNFAATFRPDPNRRTPARWRQEAMHVAVDQAAFTWQLAGSAHQWSVGGMELGIELLPAWLGESGEARFQVDPKTVVKHAELSTGMCEDVLKFIAPVLAGATTSEGNFSLKLTGGSVPFDHPRDAQLQGALTLHTVNIGAGAWYDRIVPLVNKLLPTLKIPREVTLARESVVQFELANQRVHHEGLEFGTPELHVRTSGYVGFDESLDLVAELQLQLPESDVAKLPVVRAINGRVMRLPIKGTLKHPEFDWGSRPDLKQGLMAALNGTLGPDAAARLPEALKSGGILSGADGESSALNDLGIAAGEVLKRFAERRRERQKERAEQEKQTGAAESTPPADNNPPPENLAPEAVPGPPAPTTPNPSAPPPAGTSTPAKRGTLGHVLQALAGAVAQALDEPTQPPPATNAAASPATPPVPGPVAPVPAGSSKPAEPAGPSLVPPANSAQSPSTTAATNPPPATATPATATATPASPPAVPLVVPPPPLLQTPLPAAGTAMPPAAAPPATAAAPNTPPPANPAAVPPPAADQPPPRRILGRLRTLLQSPADPNAQPAQPGAPPARGAEPGQPIPPSGSAAPPAAGAPPGAVDNPRRQALRRLLRAGIDAALEAASQPPAASPPPTPTPAAPAPGPAPAPAPENLPAPAPAPAPQ
jgi:hypothetical protein